MVPLISRKKKSNPQNTYVAEISAESEDEAVDTSLYLLGLHLHEAYGGHLYRGSIREGNVPIALLYDESKQPLLTPADEMRVVSYTTANVYLTQGRS